MRAGSIQDAVGALRRVLVRPPTRSTDDRWRAYGWYAPPDAVRAAEEHTAFRAVLEEAGAEVVVAGTDVPGDPDQIYVYDPVLVTDAGVVALRPGKAGRRGEPSALARDLRTMGHPTIGEIVEPGIAEGGDMFWLDPGTLVVGMGYRTDPDGVRQLRSFVADATIEAFDLPHHLGPDRCLHLMSLISPLDRDLVVAFPPMLPARLLQLLHERGISIVEVPEEELDTMGPNVLALGSRVALALDGSPTTLRRMREAGVDVRTYRGDEISRKGDGGPTCLTRPLERS